MLLKSKFLFLIFLVNFKVDTKSVDDKVVFETENEIKPLTFEERVKLRQKSKKLVSRFSEDSIENAGKAKKPNFNETNGVLTFKSLDSRFGSLEEKIFGKNLEYGNLFQGDLELMPEQENLRLVRPADDSEVPNRVGLIDEQYRWPKNSQGFTIVPYAFHSASHFSSDEMHTIRIAMDHIEEYTCVRFIPRKFQYDYVLIWDGDGCSSNLGRIGGQQLISLQKNGCFRPGTIVHELIHALGFDHMQNHEDRDLYVEILWDNIASEHRRNFVKNSPGTSSNFGTEYDFHSVMHYEFNAFAIDSKYATILPKNRQFTSVIGQRKGMSVGDAKRINNMYKCGEEPQSVNEYFYYY